MGINKTVVGESSNSGKGVKRGREKGVNHVEFTEEQIEVLKKVYAECTTPSHFQQSQIMLEQSSLTGIDNTQPNVWFENFRRPEQSEREISKLISENKKLIGANRLLQEENDDLQKKVTELVIENESLQNQVPSGVDIVSAEDFSAISVCRFGIWNG